MGSDLEILEVTVEPYIKTYGRQPRGLDDELWPQNFAVQRIFHQGDQVYELTEEKKTIMDCQQLTYHGRT